ncbi:MAG: antitoxin Xre/MbcA/ParS toxin-binding domain-containing protein [Motiliproteus sp.]
MLPARAKLVDADDPGKWPRECVDVDVWKAEEKQSDVNLALQAYHDAITGSVDQVVIVTNDTDLVPSLKMIREHTSVVVGLVVPTTDHKRIPNTGLAELAHWIRAHITTDELAASQLPRVIPGRKATIKPDSWYSRPDLLEQVLERATPIRGSRAKAFRWMEQDNEHMDGAAPIDLIDTDEGAAIVNDYIDRWITDDQSN